MSASIPKNGCHSKWLQLIFLFHQTNLCCCHCLLFYFASAGCSYTLQFWIVCNKVDICEKSADQSLFNLITFKNNSDVLTSESLKNSNLKNLTKQEYSHVQKKRRRKKNRADHYEPTSNIWYLTQELSAVSVYIAHKWLTIQTQSGNWKSLFHWRCTTSFRRWYSRATVFLTFFLTQVWFQDIYFHL